MIYVNQKQLDQVEYLIEQSSRGHHVLFDIDSIRDVFSRGPTIEISTDEPVVMSEGDSGDESASEAPDELEEAVEKHIENLILQPTLVAKKAYLENLPAEVFDRVVRTYFAIVENNIFEDLKFCQ